MTTNAPTARIAESAALPIPADPRSQPNSTLLPRDLRRSPDRRTLYALLAAAAVLLLIFDGPLTEAIARWMPYGTQRRFLLTVVGHLTGPSFAWIFVPIVLLLANRVRLVAGGGVPLVLTALAVQGLKFAVGRARPESATSVLHFEPFHELRHRIGSFPSGHTASAAALATFLGFLFPRARPLLWGLVALAALDRVAQEQHYLSDTLAGAALGTLMVLLCRRMLGPAWYQRVPPAAAETAR